MTFLPIVARELRVGARRRSTYRVRVYAGLIVILGGGWLFFVMHEAAPRRLAEELFSILTGCALFFALVSGCFSTADCLSEEKREGTLGLLFLTDLRGYDVVLGKLAANSLNSFYTIAAVVPLMGVPLLLGGLTPGDFARMALVALDALFFSLSAGMLVSAIFRSSPRAVTWTLLVVAFFTIGVPLAGIIIGWRANPSREVSGGYLLPSAIYAYSIALDQDYKLWAGRFWGSLALIHGLGWLFLLLASAIVPHVWQDRVLGKQRIRWREQWQRWWAGDSTTRAAFRRRLLTLNPFLWLAARARHKTAATWTGLALILAGWLWGLFKYRRDFLTEPAYYLFAAFCAHLFLRIRFAAEAPWQMAEEKKAGTLELLLSTPLRVSEIVEGQRLALQRQFLGPVLLVMGLDVVALLAPSWVREWSSWSAEAQGAWIAVWGGALVLLGADIWTLFWVGMWQGLTAKTALRASSNALGNVFMIPCVTFAIFLLWLVTSFTRSRSGPGPGPWTFFFAWFLPRIITDISFGLYIREKLFANFRLAAQLKRDPRPGFWAAALGELRKARG